MLKTAFILLILFPLSSFGATYYMALFSYDHQWIPGLSPHSFAIFYQKENSGLIKERFSLSWLPAAGPQEVSVFADKTKGKNYSFEETLDYAAKNNLLVTLSGHFKVNEELYLSALKQKEALESGNIQYQVLKNKRVGNEKVIHCVHAISDILAHKELMDTGWSYAEGANKKIKEHFKNHITPYETPFPWQDFYTQKSQLELVVIQ